MTRGKRSFGEVSKLPSGRYRARYRELNGHRVSAPNTFATRGEADRWLTLRRAELLRADWTATVTGTRSFGDYANAWLADRQLKPRTRAHYRRLLDKLILPTFAGKPIRSISPAMVRTWYSHLSPDTPTLRAHAYGLLRAILQTAVYDGEITANPAHIRGAGTTNRAVAITPATLDQLTLLVPAMPPRRQAMILLAAWCGLRFGEITELRRKDLNLDPDQQHGLVHVHRAVTRVDGQ
jgi:integrase